MSCGGFERSSRAGRQHRRGKRQRRRGRIQGRHSIHFRASSSGHYYPRPSLWWFTMPPLVPLRNLSPRRRLIRTFADCIYFLEFFRKTVHNSLCGTWRHFIGVQCDSKENSSSRVNLRILKYRFTSVSSYCYYSCASQIHYLRLVAGCCENTHERA